MDYDALISELGSHVGIKGLAFSKDNCCSVIFDADEVVFEKADGKLVMLASIGPAAGRDNLFRAILEANHIGADAALGSIGINADQEEFTLTRVLEGEESYAEFEKSLLIFIQCLRKWKKIVLDGRLDTAKEGSWSVSDTHVIDSNHGILV